MNFRKKAIKQIKNPRGWFLALVYLVTAAAIAGVIVVLCLGYENTSFQVVVYLLFALSALSFGYSVYATVRLSQRVSRGVSEWSKKYKFTDRFFRDYAFRTLFFTSFSLVISLGYGIFNGVLAILSRSIWYGALSAYYICLVVVRSFVMFYQGKKHRAAAVSETEQKLREINTYRNCGICIVVLDLALSAAVVQMVLSSRGFSHAGLMIYVSATYTVYKVTMAIVNFVRASRQDDLTVQAVRNVNLADALVSVLALQTAMFFSFSESGSFVSAANGITGGIVCLLTLVMGIGMLIRSRQRKKLLYSSGEEKNAMEEEAVKAEDAEDAVKAVDESSLTDGQSPRGGDGK